MSPPRCSVSSTCLQNGSSWSLKVKGVCSVPVWMCFMSGYYGGVRQVTPKLPYFNAPVTVRTNCFANKNEVYPGLLGGWTRSIFCLHSSVPALPLDARSEEALGQGICVGCSFRHRAHKLISALAVFFLFTSSLSSVSF